MPLLPLESTTEGSHFESAAFAGTQKKTTARTKSARPSGGVRAREEHADALPWTDVMVVLLAVLVVSRFPSVRPGGSAWPIGQNFRTRVKTSKFSKYSKVFESFRGEPASAFAAFAALKANF
jgi:hypothetical protein